MDFMPFRDLDNDALNALFPKPHFPKEYELSYDAEGNIESVFCRGVWYPCAEGQYHDIEYQDQDEDINEDQDIDQDEDQVTLDQWIDAWPESDRDTIRRACLPQSPLLRSTNEDKTLPEAFERWWREQTPANRMPSHDEDPEPLDYNLEDVD